MINIINALLCSDLSIQNVNYDMIYFCVGFTLSTKQQGISTV